MPHTKQSTAKDIGGDWNTSVSGFRREEECTTTPLARGEGTILYLGGNENIV